MKQSTVWEMHWLLVGSQLLISKSKKRETFSALDFTDLKTFGVISRPCNTSYLMPKHNLEI